MYGSELFLLAENIVATHWFIGVKQVYQIWSMYSFVEWNDIEEQLTNDFWFMFEYFYSSIIAVKRSLANVVSQDIGQFCTKIYMLFIWIRLAFLVRDFQKTL